MIVKKKEQNKYTLIPESSYDLINLSLILNRANIVLTQKQRVQKNPYQKKTDLKPKIITLCINNVSNFEFTKLDSLAITGQHKNNLITKSLHVNNSFILQKKLSKNEKKFLNNLDTKKTYYLGIDVNTILLGYTKNYQFTEIYKKEFSFKRIDYKKQILLVLNQFQEILKNNKVHFKCLTAFVSDFNKWTPYNWTALEDDVSLSWQSCVSSKIRENKLIQYFYLKKRHLWVDSPEQLLEKLDTCEIKEIFLNPSINIDLYNKIFKKDPRVIKIVPYTKALSHFLKNGFLGFLYF